MITQIGQGNSQTDVYEISWVGDVYQIGGEKFDFSQLLDGEILPQEAVGSDLIISNVTRVGTELFFDYIRQYKYDEDNIPSNEFPPTLDNTGDSL